MGVYDMNTVNGTLVTEVTGEDAHIAGIRVAEHALRDTGLRIASLAAQINADAILVSSLGGQTGFLVPGLGDECDEAGS
jgi:methylmalonyl-CoA mutase cobalamin-binding subunit